VTTVIKRKELAKVKSAFFGIEDHGILAFNIDLDFGSSGQGTGCINLQSPEGWKLTKGVLEFFGVWEWKDIGGQTLYALYEDEGYNAMIKGLERLPFDGGKQIIFQDYWKNPSS
jgi:hypothetical protein